MSCILPPACLFCLHFHHDEEQWEAQGDCAAYQEIPDEIFGDGLPHDTPLPGDNGICFEVDPELAQSLAEVNELRLQMGRPPFGAAAVDRLPKGEED
ncbi:hypothetical protein JCM17960_21310 [Magnetospira thiophila]